MDRKKRALRRACVGAGIGVAVFVVAGFAAGADVLEVVLYGIVPGALIGVAYSDISTWIETIIRGSADS